MSMGTRTADFAVRRYRAVTGVMVAVTVVIALLAALPSIRPDVFSFLNPLEVDTDPENMLAADEPVRVFHDRMKERFDLNDLIVVGVVNEEHPAGVFNPDSLTKIHELTRYALTLNGGKIGAEPGEGVIEPDVLAPSVVDAVEPTGPGEITFEWLMREPPATQAQADEVRRKAMRVPFLEGTLVSEDARAVGVYLPITRKDLSYAIYSRLQEKIATFDGPEQFHITGLPVAEDVFGVEMFMQMAVSAPAAMIVIFVLMLVFFRKLVLIVSPMIVALVSVIVTMGALVVSGFPVHIMSSMIPIFIMPIAVLDSIHIISEFFERYQETRSRKDTIRKVMDALFAPMLYTSLTSAAGFASLALTPIPPVQVFGMYVAMGIMVAWLLTVVFIPAFVMFIPPRSLENFGAVHRPGEAEKPSGALGRFLQYVSGATYRRAKLILAGALIVLVVAAYGISRINVNDNPTRWFTPSHPIRVADRVLNDHFGGTYMAYLSFLPAQTDVDALAGTFAAAAEEQAAAVPDPESALAVAYRELAEFARTQADEAPDRAAFWERLDEKVQSERSGGERSDGEPAEGSDGDAPALPGGLDGPDGEGDGPSLPGGLNGGDDPGLPSGLNGDATAPETRPDRERRRAWRQVASFLSTQRQKGQLFKDPEVLRYVADLQEYLLTIRPAPGAGTQATERGLSLVGKSNSLADIVETVHRDLRIPVELKDDEDARQEYATIPDSRGGVAETLIQYQQSHRPYDLWHFVTPDYRSASVWVQLRSGDNRDMRAVVRAVNEYVEENPLPAGLEHRWFGLTYINVVWQEKMVTGMLKALLGSFLVVFLLMTLLFRSSLWGLLSMVPLTVTIAAIYGGIGLVGKDYDMPVAVLSSLSLGLAVDFAIHFLARGRAMYQSVGSWRETAPQVFGEPARAIARNIIVIAAGFTPLLLAPLMPYKTVGVLMATILLVSGVATLLLLPALVRLLEKLLFPAGRGVEIACRCGTCLAAAVALAGVVAVNLQQYLELGWNTLALVAGGIVIVMAGGCWLSSRREKCRIQTDDPQDGSAGEENNHA